MTRDYDPDHSAGGESGMAFVAGTPLRPASRWWPTRVAFPDADSKSPSERMSAPSTDRESYRDLDDVQATPQPTRDRGWF